MSKGNVVCLFKPRMPILVLVQEDSWRQMSYWLSLYYSFTDLLVLGRLSSVTKMNYKIAFILQHQNIPLFLKV